MGIEYIVLVSLIFGGSFIAYWVGFRGPRKITGSDFTRPGSRLMRLATITAGVGLIIVAALTLEFCREQNHRMEKNTHDNHSLDNIGKGENENDKQDDGDDTQR